MSENPYKILKVDPSAPQELIKAAYRTLLKSENIHPDLGGQDDEARKIIEAYETLSDSAKKRELDRQLEQESLKSRRYQAGYRGGKSGLNAEARRQFGSKMTPGEYIVICLRCRGINKLKDPQHIFVAFCGGCKQPFMPEEHADQGPQFQQGQNFQQAQHQERKKPQKPDPSFAKYLYDRQMYYRAIEDYRALSESEPKNLDFAFMAAMCSHRMNTPKVAIKYFAKALELNPDHFASNYYMGKNLIELNKDSDAVVFLEHAKKFKKDHLKTMQLLGNCYFRLGRFADCAKILTSVIRIKPTTESALVTVGLSYLALNHFVHARIYLRMARRFFPKNTNISALLEKVERKISERYAIGQTA